MGRTPCCLSQFKVLFIRLESESIFNVDNDIVEVSSLRFCPCASLESEIKAITQLSLPNNGCNLYRRAALFIGEHHCMGCVFS